MNRRRNRRVALAAPASDTDMLREWLEAAGYRPVDHGVGKAADGDAIATVVRWPVDVDLRSLTRPAVLLYERGTDLEFAKGVFSEAIELPDSRDVRSLMAWSAMLSGLLRQIEEMAALAEPMSVVERNKGRPRDFETAAMQQDAMAARERRNQVPQVIAVGISTGGPSSLRVFFDGMREVRDLPPIVVVQHIPDAFVADLVSRLSQQTGYRVVVADDGVRLEPGVAYMSPGAHHLRIVKHGVDLMTRWDDGPPVRGHVPSVDVLFRSCAALKVHGVAVMMTGMGADGADAMRELRDRRWATIGQDETTSTIYGMPRAAMQAGAVQRQLALEQIAPWLVAYCHRAAARS